MSFRYFILFGMLSFHILTVHCLYISIQVLIFSLSYLLIDFMELYFILFRILQIIIKEQLYSLIELLLFFSFSFSSRCHGHWVFTYGWGQSPWQCVFPLLLFFSSLYAQVKEDYSSISRVFTLSCSIVIILVFILLIQLSSFCSFCFFYKRDSLEFSMFFIIYQWRTLWYR